MQTENLFELIYHSMAMPTLKADDVINILNECRNFNAPRKISGCLLLHNDEFLQILEGEKALILELFEKIKKDYRHTHVQLISQGSITHRSFANWSMAFHELKNIDRQKLNDALELDEFAELVDVVEKPTEAKRMFAFIAKDILQSNERFS